ncbi:glycoside hydrolase family 2 TIM barrel-domain containing protein [Cellulosilyticum ruminicola]|uniref:glycoside hydrolase family 2 TIM barrel-domain containing protein n=1 Tax=Cellulosilyticum ruminicola TaxID=425254 RepID=UPI000B125FA8|nr:glycoside hydrolase family 2 TIM barrel-domain containing protein [Cellulosilyticum ruminicola]
MKIVQAGIKNVVLQKREGAKYFIRFDGVYMDSTVYVNDIKIGEWKYGYSAFEMDLTEVLQNGENEIKVSVRHESPNSRWYSGAGIFRDVWFKEVESTYLVSDGIYITATPTDEALNDETIWQVEVDAEVICKEAATLSYEIIHKDLGERFVLSQEGISIAPAEEIQNVTATFYVRGPRLWDLENPNCYRLHAYLKKDDEMLQEEVVQFGFRVMEYKRESGFHLNHKHVKLNGVCEHHDLGCLGAAYNEAAMRRKFDNLRAMGVNAVRTSHNMPAENMMYLADELGFLILAEGFDMWERSKTTYDYARFFDDWYKKDVASWIRRDRNHPSIIMWSIGNEIYDTHEGVRGQEVTRMLLTEVTKHDPKKHAPVTIGSNYMAWENAQKCADIVKMAGYNYGEKYYDAHHEKYKDWITYGSETASVLQSRGIYHFPLAQSILVDEDQQCSALGNCAAIWGAKNHEFCITHERDTHYSCGQFLWSGHDYIGEPTPYQTKSCYFGQIDTAGFPKDSFYIYQAEWTDYKKSPMVHLLPYWDFNEGELIDIRICSNAPKIELFLNGISQGTYEIDHAHGKELLGNWQIPYTKGEIEAVAYDENGNIIARDCHKSFTEPAQIIMKPGKTEILADGKDLVFIEITMLDKDNNPVENANNRVAIEVSEGGMLMGLDNGDSTDYDSYKGSSKRLFSGKLLAVVAVNKSYQGQKVTIKASSIGLPDTTVDLQVLGTGLQNSKCDEGMGTGLQNSKSNTSKWGEVPIRKIEIISLSGTVLNEELREVELTAKIWPENATYDELTWQVVDDAVIPSHLAVIEPMPLEEGEKGSNQKVAKVKLKALGDGNVRVRCLAKNGKEVGCLISQLTFTITGIGTTYRNPYEFISGGTHDFTEGNVASGKEKGFATALEEQTIIGFNNIDFGSYGSDEITMPIFVFDDRAYDIEIWEGMPYEIGSTKVAQVVYQKPCIWDVYQEDTYKLNKRLKGISSIYFVFNDRAHVKGFSFKAYNRALEQLNANECDCIYGDQFKVTEDAVNEIGNNVTIAFDKMDFGEEGVSKLTICGHSPIDKNSIHLRSDNGEEKQLLEFLYSEGDVVRTYEIKKLVGVQDVAFVFLPGSNFNFKWFKFEA